MATIASPLAGAAPTSVHSSSDLLSGIDSTSLFAGIDAISSDGIETEPDAPEIEDAPVEDEPLTEQAPAESEQPKDDTPVDEPVADAPPAEVPPVDPTAEELPEGVRKGKDSKGKEKYFLEPNRYETFHGHHKLVQEATAALGEPLTIDNIKLHADAYDKQEMLFNNLASGLPEEQGSVVKALIDEMKLAHTEGEVGIDPTIPFADSVYDNLRDHAPEAYDRLNLRAARTLLQDMYTAAAQSNNIQLFSSAQHIAKTLAGIGDKPANMTPDQWVSHIREATSRMELPFYVTGEMQGMAKGEDPLVIANRKIQELESKVNGRSETGTAEQWNTWQMNHVKEVNQAVLNDAVKPILASVEEAWKNYPADFKRLVDDPLNREVAAAVKADPALKAKVQAHLQRAQRATSEQVRQSIGKQIQQLYVDRAKLALDTVKVPILKFAATVLKGRSDTNHERREGAQTRTTPKGASAPVKESLLPPTIGFKGGVYDSTTALRQAAQLLANSR